jgi:hypothetical protein
MVYIAVVFAFAGCQGDKKVGAPLSGPDAESSAKVKAAMAETWEPLNLTHGNVDLVIDAPRGCMIETGYRTYIRKGPYQIEVCRGHEDLQRAQKLAKSSDLHAFLGTVIDEKLAFAYRQRGHGGAPEYVFYVNTTLAKDLNHITDIELCVSAEVVSPLAATREQLDWLLKSAKTIRLATKDEGGTPAK